MRRLEGRRGAVVVLLAIMMVAVLAITAIAMDFSRLWALRNELQTAADAGAHAGALQLLPPNNAAFAADSAQAYALRNHAMAGVVTVDSIQLGDWDDVSKTFATPGATTDAINVVVSRPATGLVMKMLGVPIPTVRARAIGWADAPVVDAGCMRPWAMPYATLMATLYRKRHCPGNPNCGIPLDSLIRPWDNVDDLTTLNSMTVAERTFNLKLASPGNGGGGGGGGRGRGGGGGGGSGSSGGVDSVTAGYMPGNFHAVMLPKYWDAATGQYTNPAPQSGANAYRDHVSGAGCPSLTIGDSLMTEPGNMTGPTIQGALGQNPAQGPGFCATIESGNPNASNFGDCLDAAGNHPVVKAPFYVCTTGCSGRSVVGVRLLGSFTIMKIIPSGSDKSAITGVFNPMTSSGPVGHGGTTLIRPILVK